MSSLNVCIKVIRQHLLCMIDSSTSIPSIEIMFLLRDALLMYDKYLKICFVLSVFPAPLSPLKENENSKYNKKRKKSFEKFKEGGKATFFIQISWPVYYGCRSSRVLIHMKKISTR